MKKRKGKERVHAGRRSFELLWGGRQRLGPGPRPALSLERTVRAAVEVVDAEGLEALTMGRVAERLGVTPMAIYRYVPGKEELIDLMIDMARGVPPESGGLGWRRDLAKWARANFAVLHGHPWLLGSVMSRVPIGPNWLAWVESAIRSLSGVNLNAKEMLAVVILVDGHVRASAQIALGVTGTGEWADTFGRMLETVRSDARYPELAALVASGAFEEGAHDSDDVFEFGLERLLDGVDALIRTRGHRP
jgi:AcrR family transcriptional regulator